VECGYPYDLPESERPEKWYTERNMKCGDCPERSLEKVDYIENTKYYWCDKIDRWVRPLWSCVAKEAET